MILVRRFTSVLGLVASALLCGGCSVEHVDFGKKPVDCSIVQGVQSIEEFNSMECTPSSRLAALNDYPMPSAAEENELWLLRSEQPNGVDDAHRLSQAILSVCISILGGASDEEIADEGRVWFGAEDEVPVEEVATIARAIRAQGWCESDYFRTP